MDKKIRLTNFPPESGMIRWEGMKKVVRLNAKPFWWLEEEKRNKVYKEKGWDEEDFTKDRTNRW